MEKIVEVEVEVEKVVTKYVNMEGISYLHVRICLCSYVISTHIHIQKWQVYILHIYTDLGAESSQAGKELLLSLATL